MTHTKHLTLLSVLIAGTSLVAQMNSMTTLTGVVKDASGKPIQGATLALTSNQITGNKTVTSDAKGAYRIPLLLPGTYKITVTHDSHQGSEITLQLPPGQIIRQDVVLKDQIIGTKVVEVISPSESNDKSNPTTSSSLTPDKMRDAGVSTSTGSDSFISEILSATPGAHGRRIRGGMGYGLKVTVNGVRLGGVVDDNGLGGESTEREKEAFIFENIENIKVIQNPLHAKYGNVSGGLVEITTKRGSNDFSGSITWDRIEKSTWRTDAQHDASRNPLKPRRPQDGRRGIGAAEVAGTSTQIQFSGPIIKDHLTFSYAHKGANAGDSSGSRQHLATMLLKDSALSVTDTNRWLTAVPGLTNGLPSLDASGNVKRDAAGNPEWARPSHLMANAHNRDLLSRPEAQILGSTRTATLWNQYNLFWQVGPQHQLSLGYTTNQMRLKPFGGEQHLDLGPIEASIAHNESKSINYQGLLGSSVSISATLGTSTERSSYSPLLSGQRDPLAVLHWTSGANDVDTSLFAEPAASDDFRTLYHTGGPQRYGQNKLDEALTANFSCNWVLGNHSLDAGIDWDVRTARSPEDSGYRRVQFFMPGDYHDGRYLVYNYWESAWVGAYLFDKNSGDNKSMDGFLPEARVWTGPGADRGETQRRSFGWSLNDQWQVNDRLGFLFGLRSDTSTLKDYRGVVADSTALSPRLQVTWDLHGDNTHLLQASYAVMRGHLGDNIPGSFLIGARGTIEHRVWGFEGDGLPGSPIIETSYPTINFDGTPGADLMVREVDPRCLKTLAEISDLNNYTLVATEDPAQNYKIPNRSLTPETVRQWEADYKRTFQNGGSFRLALVYRKTTDLMVENRWNASVLGASGQLPLYTLDLDPIAYRVYKALEMEWDAPVIEGKDWELNWSGNWTIARNKGRDPQGSRMLLGNTYLSSSSQYTNVPVGESVGATIDEINAYGDLDSTPHHAARSTFTFSHGIEKGVKTRVSINITYNSGGGNGEHLVESYYKYPINTLYPVGGEDEDKSGPSFSFSNFQRGTRVARDQFGVDLTWGITIPIQGKLSCSLNGKIDNLFNRSDIRGDVLSPDGVWPQGDVLPGEERRSRSWHPHWARAWRPQFSTASPYSGGNLASWSNAYLSRERSFSLTAGIRF